MENIYTTLWLIYAGQCTKFCQNRSGFVDYTTKTFWCFSVHTSNIVVHLQNANAKFHKVV